MNGFVRFILIGWLATLPVSAQIKDVPHSKHFFDDPGSQKVEAVRVPSVRAVLVDYHLIASDFPRMRRRENESESDWKARIRRWLERQTNYIDKNQALQQEVNTEIPHTDETKTVIKPKGYNRGHVIEVDCAMDNPGEVAYNDAKGTGSQNPKQAAHSNGLATLGEMIREFVYEKGVSRAFAYISENNFNVKGVGSNPVKLKKVTTVGSYAVMDYGFDVVHADGSKSRAGYVLRQAHKRASGFNSSLPVEVSLQIELAIRKLGLTSSGETYDGKYNWDYINMQGTNNKEIAEVVDFGAFLAVEKFERNLMSPANVYGTPLVTPQSPIFVQPDSNLRLPFDMWGYDSGKSDPKADRPWIWSHELAQAWAEGRAGLDAFETHLNNFLEPVKRRLPLGGYKCGYLVGN